MSTVNTADLQNLTRRFWQGQKAKRPGRPGHSESAELLEIVGTEEIAKLSGFTPKSLRVFSCRADFPSPVARVKRRLFWRKDDIEHWIKVKKGE